MKRLVKCIVIALAVVLLTAVLTFVCGRYGWRLFGFSSCEGARVDCVEVTQGQVRLVGGAPGVFADGCLGYIAEEQNGTLYVGFRFDGVFGMFESGDFDVTIETSETINTVILKSDDSETVLWDKGEAIVSSMAVAPIADGLSLDSEYIGVTVLGDIAKIDIVSPGLDTYSLRVALVDLETGGVLSETAFSEAAWLTGLTDNGFYMIDQTTATVSLYDRNGNRRDQQTFATEAWSPVAAVSTDERYTLYHTVTDGMFHIYDRESGEERTVAIPFALRESVGFENGAWYVRGVDGALAALDPSNGEVRLVMDDPRLNIVAPSLGLGTTLHNFIVADGTRTVYVPMHTVDEWVVGVGESGFATTVALEKTERLRYYNIHNRTVATWEIGDHVETVCVVNEQCVLAVAGDAMQKQHTLYLCNIRNEETTALTLYDRDESRASEPTISVPEALPSENTTLVDDVPLIAQFPAYPTGCESVSAVMALQYAGVDIGVDTFVDAYLPKSAAFYEENGKRYGPNPYEVFIGDPRSSASYGCMAPVIEQALTACLGDAARVKNTTDSSLESLCRDYIDNGVPVLVWATIHMLETVPTNTWYLADGTRFTWPGNEHCMVLVGYDETHYYFHDPYAGTTVKYEKQLVADRYAELGSQSVVVL